MQLFVYGSLLRGMSLSSYMEGTKFLGPAYVKADLFYLGFYPGIIKGNQIVFGELYEVNEKQLPVIDEVEDYIELDNERSAYLRKPIKAYMLSDGMPIKAQAYFYNRSSEGKERILSGDYRKYMNKSEDETSWIIGYANNLSTQSMHTRFGYVPEYKKGYVDGFERVYNVKTGLNGNAAANLVYKGGMQRCKAVVWKLNHNQIETLDAEEKKYTRISLPFTTSEGELLHAQSYLGISKHLGKNLHPDPDCLQVVNSGLNEHGFR